MATPLLPRAAPPVAAALVLLATFSPPLRAQPTPQRLIGGAFGGTAFVQQQTLCAPPARLCALPYGLPAAAFAGGSAYDPALLVLWDTDGVQITGVRVHPAVAGCAVVCPPTPIPALPPGVLATGLAVDAVNRTLWMLDSSPALTAWDLPARDGCPLLRGRCSLVGLVPPTMVPAGLAVSARHQLIWVAMSVFGGGPPNNTVLAARLGNPCTPLCTFAVPDCPAMPPLAPITGLAFDDCGNLLHATDGGQVTTMVMAPPCTIVSTQCCIATPGGSYHGLCIESSHAAATGASCTSGACPTCLALRLSANDAALGNARFALRIDGAPAPAAAIAFLGRGPCGAGTPILCGAFYPALPPPITLPPMSLAGTAPCGGAAEALLGVPMDPALCGAALCAQAIVVCISAAGTGVGLTNALDLMISDG